MAELAIRVEHIAKKYRTGRGLNSFPTLREQLGRVFERRAANGVPAQAPDPWFWALNDVSFDVRHGEVLGIVGSNGAGKSTLLKILSRIVEPTVGRIEAVGRLGCLLDVGSGFHPELTGRENVYLNGAILGMSRRETAAKFDEIVAFSAIERFIDTPVKRYSNGMYLRLGFAVAAHIEPDILIVDEVLAVGDAAFQAKCIGKVGELVVQGRTVLIVSHQLPVIQKLCSRAILIRGGEIVKDGAPRQVIGEHLHALERDAEIDLAARVLRAGNSHRRIERIDIIGASGMKGGPLIAGERAEFVIHVGGSVGASTCAFEFFDELGQGVTSFNSANFGSGDTTMDGDTGHFRCMIDELPVRPGRYRVDVAITSRFGALEDHVEGAAYFEVLPGVLRGRQVDADPGYGNISVPHRWACN